MRKKEDGQVNLPVRVVQRKRARARERYNSIETELWKDDLVGSGGDGDENVLEDGQIEKNPPNSRRKLFREDRCFISPFGRNKLCADGCHFRASPPPIANYATSPQSSSTAGRREGRTVAVEGSKPSIIRRWRGVPSL